MLTSDEFQELRVRSFYLNGTRVCESLVLYLNFASLGLVSLTIGEGVAILSKDVPSEEIRLNEDVEGDPAYPVVLSAALERYVGKQLYSIFEYRINNISEGCVGVYFDCGGCGFSVMEEDGCLSFLDGKTFMGDDIAMVELEGWLGRPKEKQ
ncbi:hypothetical protein [Pseudomonas moraviensis]|uniref:hypothetical protein n=1 Tax=Pseudomonas moraviensis TaxID=321662 RepID=UPI0011CE3FC6|nr:hypothetical protein [Pseudomonas moraviensis]